MKIKEGDIFRWCYKDEKPSDIGSYRRYHCKSQIAIACTGLLRDTYWGGGAQDSSVWGYEEALDLLTLKHIGNFDALDKRPEYEAMYYADADCVNLNHPNSSRDNFYIRKGAKRCRAKMYATLAERAIEAEREMRFAEGKLERARIQLVAIERGDNLDEMHL